MNQIAVIAIGRNEGERLRACLESLRAQGLDVIYVDSGSTDSSVELAREMGAEVVELSADRPFTAARGRNAGFEALKQRGLPEFVQLLDGDCALVEGWIDAGIAALQSDPGLGLVTGWRSEIHREASVYNALCDVEWRRPAGPIRACGGDMLLRAEAFEAVNGFREDVIAAEDDEFCLRLAAAGWRLERLPLEMSLHDAAMTRFSEWWRRSVRNGHGFAQLGDLHRPHLARERLRVWIFGLALPLLALLLAFLWPIGLLGILALYLGSYLRSAQGLMRTGQPGREAAHHALFLSLSKFPNLIGMATYYLRRARGAAMRIIEYK